MCEEEIILKCVYLAIVIHFSFSYFPHLKCERLRFLLNNLELV